jgi:hypothetical protein
MKLPKAKMGLTANFQASIVTPFTAAFREVMLLEKKRP